MILYLSLSGLILPAADVNISDVNKPGELIILWISEQVCTSINLNNIVVVVAGCNTHKSEQQCFSYPHDISTLFLQEYKSISNVKLYQTINILAKS